MRVLALRGAHVIGTARTPEKGRHACARVVGRATPVVLELTSFPSVVECAKRIRALTPRIDMSILRDCSLAPQSEHQRDAAMAGRLWDVSARLVAEYLT